MAFASKLPTLGRRVMTVSRPFAMRAQQAMRLNKPMVFQMLRPAPVKGNDLSGFGADTPPEPNAWDAANKGIQSLAAVVGTGTKFYVDREQTKALQQQADMADAQARTAQQKADLERQYMLESQRAAAVQGAIAAGQAKGLPPWVLPVAIGGVLIAGLGGYFLLKKKA